MKLSRNALLVGLGLLLVASALAMPAEARLSARNLLQWRGGSRWARDGAFYGGGPMMGSWATWGPGSWGGLGTWYGGAYDDGWFRPQIDEYRMDTAVDRQFARAGWGSRRK